MAQRMRTPLKVPGAVIVCVAALCLGSDIRGYAQSPWNNLDLVQIYVNTRTDRTKEAERQRIESNQVLVDSGAASILDLGAPSDAVDEFNRSLELMKGQNSKEAIKHLQKAIAAYPKFVSAHVNLGIAYLDQSDTGRARSEFETATKLDDKFSRSFLNLGVLSMSQKDFGSAESQLEKAAALRPKDARTLATLARAQSGNHHYQRSLETVQRVHGLEHKEFADSHYVGAAAALALNDFETMERELGVFLSEDPANALAPNARHNLDILAHNKDATMAVGAAGPKDPMAPGASQQFETFPNSENLKAQLTALGDDTEGGTCDECESLEEATASAEGGNSGAAAGDAAFAHSSGTRHDGQWTIRAVVDEVVQFFSVSSHGRLVSGLQPSDIQIWDDNKPPAKVLQFIPQSKLPLRLALLMDTSSSVQDRFRFEKHAASKLVQKGISGASDLGFVAGFAGKITVTQDFTADVRQISAGLDKLTNGGGTRLFDAVSFACRKLAAYPERERVARVLVVLSDGEDNSSHRSLKQSIQDAEATGVTVYIVSTKEGRGPKTDADKVLEALAERSGGEAMFPGDMATLAKTLDKLGDLIRSRYLVAYSPADFVPNGSYRTIRISAEKNGKRLQVHARKGYYARLEAPHQ
jgi:Ca-activated chloride channel family protein